LCRKSSNRLDRRRQGRRKREGVGANPTLPFDGRRGKKKKEKCSNRCSVGQREIEGEREGHANLIPIVEIRKRGRTGKRRESRPSSREGRGLSIGMVLSSSLKIFRRKEGRATACLLCLVKREGKKRHKKKRKKKGHIPSFS